ncbi:hypothetical protein ElyMa_006534100 [Elysia marginata]|uniref:Uncharacterized protein n=1 Tax=Elysia marginata TaxID=1093978 RepID=A0AAV4IAC1_9GAST|nr:hypothetical protein ElyMa_006534100 [Elysia marginata]
MVEPNWPGSRRSEKKNHQKYSQNAEMKINNTAARRPVVPDKTVDFKRQGPSQEDEAHKGGPFASQCSDWDASAASRILAVSLVHSSLRVLHRRRQSHDLTYLPQLAYTPQSPFNKYVRALQYGNLLSAQILAFHKFQALPLARYPFYRWMDGEKLGYIALPKQLQHEMAWNRTHDLQISSPTR